MLVTVWDLGKTFSVDKGIFALRCKGVFHLECYLKNLEGESINYNFKGSFRFTRTNFNLCFT